MFNKKAISVSVVIPVYNRATVIEQSVNSVIRQTNPPYEIIIVNDGSSDNTLDVCKKIAWPNLKIITLDKNKGAQKARNIGILAAKGNWIAFQDSDDEWLPNQLDKLVERLREVDYNLDTVVYCDCYVQEGQFEPRKIWRRPHVEGENIFREVLIHGGPLFQGMLTSREALEKMGLLDENVQAYQEWETAIRLSHFCRFLHVQEPLFIYHRQTEGSISKNREHQVQGFQYILNKFRNDIALQCGVDIWRNHLIYLYLLCFNAGLWSRRIRFSREFSLDSREEDRIVMNMIINKLSSRDWSAANLLLKDLHHRNSVKALLLKAHQLLHWNPWMIIAIRRVFRKPRQGRTR